MTCRKCQHDTARKFGFYGRRRIQRYRCSNCKATFCEPVAKVGNHYTAPDVAAKAIQLMLEGMSVRAISRFTGLDKGTILALMLTAAQKAREVLDAKIQNIAPKFVQMDELWTFVGCKEPNLPKDATETWGSWFVWLAIDSDTKLLISHNVAARNTAQAYPFVRDVAERTVGRVQITTDSLNSYVMPIREFFAGRGDFAQLHKIYSKGSDGRDRYSPPKCIGAFPHLKMGRPDFTKISTSHIERQNLSVRMHLRRFTRLTNAFSKKLDNLKAAVTLYVAFYNFCRVHQTLKTTPAVAAGIADHAWTINELLGA